MNKKLNELDSLHASEEIFNLFIEHAPAALAMFDRDMCYLKVSRRWKEDYFIGDRDIIGVSHYEIFPEIQERWKSVHRRSLAGEVIRSDEDCFERKDGTCQWLRWEVLPWHLSDGVIGGIIIFSEDITTHKKLELELRKNAEKLSMVIRASKLGIWDSDRTNGRVIFDKHWCNIIGCQQEELVLTRESWLELIHPEDLARVITATKEHELGNTPLFQCEYRLRHQEGHWIWVSSRGQIVARDEQGGVLRILGTIKDISGPKNIAYESAEFLRRIETLVKGLELDRHETQNVATAKISSDIDMLSKRQREVLILISQGMTSSKIAEKIGVGVGTVISHRRSLMKALGLHSTADLTRFAIKHELLSE